MCSNDYCGNTNGGNTHEMGNYMCTNNHYGSTNGGIVCIK